MYLILFGDMFHNLFNLFLRGNVFFPHFSIVVPFPFTSNEFINILCISVHKTRLLEIHKWDLQARMKLKSQCILYIAAIMSCIVLLFCIIQLLPQYIEFLKGRYSFSQSLKAINIYLIINILINQLYYHDYSFTFLVSDG